MGKESSEVYKKIKGIGNLQYVEIKSVPMKSFPGYGDAIEASVLKEIEKQVAREIIIQRIPVRGLEIEYFRSILGLSQREFAQKLGLSHVAILKWEKAKQRPLDLVNEVAVKALMAGILGLRLPASIEALSSDGVFPKKLSLDYAKGSGRQKKKSA